MLVFYGEYLKIMPLSNYRCKNCYYKRRQYYYHNICELIWSMYFIMSTSKDPLHGKTLEVILTELVASYGWNDLGNIIRINCFNNNPGIKSSLTFLRKTPWARKKVEELYLRSVAKKLNG